MIRGMPELADAHLFLAASLLPLVIGPVAARLARRSAATSSALDAFVAVAVGGITVLHILPHAFLDAGSAALAAAVAGFLVPVGLERVQERWRRGTRSGLVLLAFLGLGLHATVDGVALFVPGGEHLAEAAGNGHSHAGASLLALAVILHRFPMALAIWWFAVPNLGRKVAVGLLAAIGVATVVGFTVADRLWLGLSSPGIALLQAAVAGMLLHVVVGHHHGVEGIPARGPRFASALGALAGAGVIAAMAGIHPLERLLPGELGTGVTFATLALAAAPALLVAYLGVGFLHAFVPARLRPLVRSVAGPRQLDRAAGHLSPTVATLHRALHPEIQLPAFFLSLLLLGPPLTLYRLAAAVALVGLVVLSFQKQLAERAKSAGERPANHAADGAKPPLRRRLLAGLDFGFGPAVDATLPPFLLGLGVAALIEPLADFAWLRAQPGPTQLAVAAVFGGVFYLNGLGAAPIVAVLAHKGFSTGPLLAFLLAGVAVAAFRPVARRFGRRAALDLSARGILLAVIAGYALDGPLPAGGIELHRLAATTSAPVAVAALLLLLALVLVSLFRQGFRDFLTPASTRADRQDDGTGPPRVVGQERLEQLLG